MTTYTPILGVETDPGKPVKSDLAKRWSDNVLAIIEGDASAVSAGKQVARPALVDAVVNRVKLDTGTASQAWSTTAGGGDLNIAMNPYSFFPAHNNTSGVATLSIGNTGTNADLPRARVQIGGVGSGTFYWRYINV